MASRVAAALDANESAEEVAKAAVADATSTTQSEAEKEALGLALYKEATGRFPQDSSDRRAVYMGGFALVAIIFVLTAVAMTVLLLKDKTVPDALWAIATALGSGIVGGLFGYAKQ